MKERKAIHWWKDNKEERCTFCHNNGPHIPHCRTSLYYSYLIHFTFNRSWLSFLSSHDSIRFTFKWILIIFNLFVVFCFFSSFFFCDLSKMLSDSGLCLSPLLVQNSHPVTWTDRVWTYDDFETHLIWNSIDGACRQKLTLLVVLLRKDEFLMERWMDKWSVLLYQKWFIILCCDM